MKSGLPVRSIPSLLGGAILIYGAALAIPSLGQTSVHWVEALAVALAGLVLLLCRRGGAVCQFALPGILAVAAIAALMAGIMRLNLSAALVLSALFWFASARPSRLRALPPMFAFALLALAGIDLVGGWLKLEFLYPFYDRTRMPTGVALAMFALGLGLLDLSLRASRNHPTDDGAKITVISAVILLAVALIGGLAGFAIVAQSMETVIRDSLRVSFHDRARTVGAAIDRAIENANLISSRPRLNVLMARISRGEPLSQSERAEIERILNNIARTTGISGIVLADAKGTAVGARGTLLESPRYRMPLNTRHPTSIIANDKVFLNATVPMTEGGQRVGSLTVDFPLHTIDALFRDFTGLGETGTMGICGPLGEKLQCLPSRANNYKGAVAPRHVDGRPVPMHYALQGITGVDHGIDIQRTRILSAYGPIGDLGIGLIVKVRTTELYRPIRQRFEQKLGLLFVLALSGLALLRWQISPLARKLVQEIKEREHAEGELRYLANHDSLTGLPNRTLFAERLKQAVIEAERHERLVGVFFLDLDRFKTINDTLGHEVGDELLKRVAERLSRTLRPGDTISRQGGDEFTIILANVGHIDHLVDVARKILQVMADPFDIGNHQLFITTSIGISVYPFDDADAAHLVRDADAAMYLAKEQGRNTYRFFTAELNERAAKRLQLETALRFAIEREEFVLHYQPQIQLRSGRITGMEALLRWEREGIGLVSPADFIPIAEETGLIVPIGEWLLRKACDQLAQWHALGHTELHMAVNLSGRQFQQENLSGLVRQVLTDTALPRGSLELEITESTLIKDRDAATAMMRQLAELGVSVALDDFGTGYSSLSYLTQLPLTRLKLDQSFVKDIPDNENATSVATGIVLLAKALHLKVTAEGVETERQLQFLRQLACDDYQGFLFSKPLPADAMLELLNRNAIETTSTGA